MKFRNLTDDTLNVLMPQHDLAFTVAPGEWTPELDDEQSAGLVEQTSVWASDAPAPAAPVVVAPQPTEPDIQSVPTENQE